jgi:hypothetical protein
MYNALLYLDARNSCGIARMVDLIALTVVSDEEGTDTGTADDQ